MNNKRNPCYHCERRAFGCHATCKEHAAWAAARRAEQDARRANELAERDIEITKKKYRRA